MKKYDPSSIGQIIACFNIIVDVLTEYVKANTETEKPEALRECAELELTKKGCEKAIVLKSPRLISAFTWLQDKAGLTIKVADLAEYLGCNKDETRKALQTLRTDKKLIHYTVTEEGIKLIRVDDLDRLKPRIGNNNGVKDNESEIGETL